MQKTKEEIKQYIQQQFGYDLNKDLRECRAKYTFDSICQGSVPIAIMAFLQAESPEKQLRLAISMGGNSDTIAAITCSIATAQFISNSNDQFANEVVNKCRSLLKPDLLDINDRFIEFIVSRQSIK